MALWYRRHWTLFLLCERRYIYVVRSCQNALTVTNRTSISAVVVHCNVFWFLFFCLFGTLSVVGAFRCPRPWQSTPVEENHSRGKEDGTLQNTAAVLQLDNVRPQVQSVQVQRNSLLALFSLVENFSFILPFKPPIFKRHITSSRKLRQFRSVGKMLPICNSVDKQTTKHSGGTSGLVGYASVSDYSAQ